MSETIRFFGTDVPRDSFERYKALKKEYKDMLEILDSMEDPQRAPQFVKDHAKNLRVALTKLEQAHPVLAHIQNI